MLAGSSRILNSSCFRTFSQLQVSWGFGRPFLAFVTFLALSYQSNSWQRGKDSNGTVQVCGVKLIIFATTVLCMSVNFPDVRFIINGGASTVNFRSASRGWESC